MSANEKRRPARGGAQSEPGGFQSTPNYREPQTAASPVIVIDDEAFGQAIDVTVNPSQPVGHDREFTTHSGAVLYAEQLSKATGWRVIDRSDAGLG